MRVRTRFVGVLTLLVLAMALVPGVAMAAPTITQGVRGMVMDSSTGVGIPFAPIVIQVDGGASQILSCEYDGTYSYSTAVSANVTISCIGIFYMSDSAGPLAVTAGAVTIQDFSLDRGPIFQQAVYRFFNRRGGVHFYTASDKEFISVYKNLGDVFHYDGVAYYVPWGESSDPSLINPNTFPLYRFYNRNTGLHFYTMSEQEKANVIATRGEDYTYEGVAYWVSDRVLDTSVVGFLGIGGGFPVHRFYLPARDAHFFTSNGGEIWNPFTKLATDYQYEGVGFYINGWRSVETDSAAP